MSTYPPKKLLELWNQIKLTVEQAVGHLLQNRTIWHNGSKVWKRASDSWIKILTSIPRKLITEVASCSKRLVGQTRMQRSEQ